MKNSEENTLHMFKDVVAVLVANSSITAAIPQFSVSKDEFTDLIADIDEANQLLINAAEGKTDEKTNAEEELENLLIVFCGKFFVYARRKKNEELKSLTNINDSALKKLRDRELIDKAELIQRKAADHNADLVQYGITETEITLLDTKIKAFEAKIGEQGTGYSGRGGARKSLNTLFADANGILKEELDGMMESFYETNPDFYNQYISARGIKNLGIRHRKNKNNNPNSDAGDGKS
jgi:hypothetical protein